MNTQASETTFASATIGAMRCRSEATKTERSAVGENLTIRCRFAAPKEFEKNWIPTVPGKNWFAYFRFYGPTQPYFDKSWPLLDFEIVK